MTIGEVMAQLSGDFPDVTISKIRFLEEQGLVEPERTPAGYRKFSEADVERLRYVLGAQRDHYLPLKVIKEHLEALDRGFEPPALPGATPVVPRPGGGGADDGVERFSSRAARLRITRGELLRDSGADEELLQALETFGIVSAEPGGPWFDGEALEVVRAAAGLAAFGIEARHLRTFRTAADRELALVEQVVAPLQRQRQGEVAARAGEAARDIAALCVRLHTALVASGVHRLTG
ncbi:MerR family transcriptional regulator [Kineococcus xinjiangensis]